MARCDYMYGEARCPNSAIEESAYCEMHHKEFLGMFKFAEKQQAARVKDMNQKVDQASKATDNSHLAFKVQPRGCMKDGKKLCHMCLMKDVCDKEIKA